MSFAAQLSVIISIIIGVFIVRLLQHKQKCITIVHKNMTIGSQKDHWTLKANEKTVSLGLAFAKEECNLLGFWINGSYVGKKTSILVVRLKRTLILAHRPCYGRVRPTHKVMNGRTDNRLLIYAFGCGSGRTNNVRKCVAETRTKFNDVVPRLTWLIEWVRRFV